MKTKTNQKKEKMKISSPLGKDSVEFELLEMKSFFLEHFPDHEKVNNAIEAIENILVLLKLEE